MTTLASTYLEYVQGSSAKFYRAGIVERDGAFDVTADWGRIGTAGQHAVKGTFPNEPTARGHFERLVIEKTNKGYTPAADPAAPSNGSVAVATPAPLITTPDGLPVFPAQLAGAKCDLAAVFAAPEAYAVEEKFDGFRGLLRLVGDEVEVLNRHGQNKGRGKNTPALISAMRQLAAAHPQLRAGTILDGELAATSWNETATLLGSAGQTRDGLRFIVFDVPYLAGSDLRDLPWSARRAQLETLLADAPAPLQISALLPASQATVDAVWARGGEGVIVKDRSAPYLPGDRNAWRKVKLEQSAEGVISGFKPGQGKYANQVGAVLVSQYRAGALVEVAAVSGMTDALRTEITADPDAYLGQVIEFKYHERTDERYRHPRWFRIRSDKAAADCAWEAS